MGQLDYLKTFPSLVFNKVEKKVNGDITNEVILAMDAAPKGDWLVVIPVEESLKEGDIETSNGINIIRLLTKNKYQRELKALDVKYTNRLNEIENKFNMEISEYKNYVNKKLQDMQSEYQRLIQEAIATAKKYTDDRIAEVAPIGSIICFMGFSSFNRSDILRSYIAMDGANLSNKPMYSQLALLKAYNDILPDMTIKGKFLGGGERHNASFITNSGGTSEFESLPNVKGVFGHGWTNTISDNAKLGGAVGTYGTGPFYNYNNGTQGTPDRWSSNLDPCGFNLNKGCHIYKDNAKVQPDHYTMFYYIRYRR